MDEAKVKEAERLDRPGREKIIQETKTLLFNCGVINFIETFSSNFADQILALFPDVDKEEEILQLKDEHLDDLAVVGRELERVRAERDKVVGEILG